jgi:hypothetical protein
MNIGAEVVVGIASIAASAGASFGIIKTRLNGTMTYGKHREICDKERAITNAALQKLQEMQVEMHGMIKEIHGYMRAKNGGTL